MELKATVYCRELAKDLAQNLIGQSDDGVAMFEGENDEC